MTAEIHPLAPATLPPYIGSADGSDGLLTVVIWLLVIIFMVVGNLYLKLHALPERMAHKRNNTQLQFIAVLAILALFTHNNVFWVLALLLSVVRIPDFSTPINSIAESQQILAGRESNPPDVSSEPDRVDPDSSGDSGTEAR